MANPLRQLRASDLRAVARPATQATTGISRVAEGVHQSVLGTLGLPGGAEPLVEWHGALRWVQAPESAGEALREAARAVGGNASVFVAASAGGTGAKGLFDLKSAALEQIHARLKHSFDPAGIFNPGRVARAW